MWLLGNKTTRLPLYVLYLCPPQHSAAHHKKTRHFWWVNGAKSNLMQTYLIFSAEYRRWGQLTASFPDYDASPYKSLGMGLLLSVTKIYTRELL